MSNQKSVTSIEVQLKPSQVRETLSHAIKVGDSVMIWGSPGIGKSDISRQVANDIFPTVHTIKKDLERLARNLKVTDTPKATQHEIDTLKARATNQKDNFIDFRLSQIEPSDIRGIPIKIEYFVDEEGTVVHERDMKPDGKYKQENGVVWASPEIFKLPADWKGIIMFDEINSAMPIVQAAAYQIFLDRRIGELVIPDGAFILAAGNRDMDGGVTFDLATPLRDRMTHIEMIADFNDWHDNYAVAHRIHPKIVGFLRQGEARFFNTLSKNEVSHCAGSSPRSWVKLSDYEWSFEEKTPKDIIYRGIVAGRVGSGIATEYIAYTKNIEGLPDVMDIMERKQGAILKDNVLNDGSKVYFVTLNATYKLIDLYTKASDGLITKEEYHTYANNFLWFINSQLTPHNHKEVSIMALRILLNNKVPLSASKMPEYKNVINDYKDLLSKSMQTKL